MLLAKNHLYQHGNSDTIQYTTKEKNVVSVPTVGEVAQYYQKMGWPVLPIHYPTGASCSCRNSDCNSIGKHPMTKHGVKDASLDLKTLERWFARWPDMNIGIAVGEAKLIVIDIDSHKGSSFQDLPLHPYDTYTPMCQTGSGGHHIYYRAPIGFEVGNSNVLLPDHIDVRAVGSYIVAPPSKHHSENHYLWYAGRAPWEISFLPLPASLLPLLKIKGKPASTPTFQPSQVQRVHTGPLPRYVEVIIQSELDRLRSTRSGGRNDALNRCAFCLGQVVEAGFIAQPEVETLLMEAAQSIGLGEEEIKKTIFSGLQAGLEKPRTWPESVLELRK